MRGGAKMTPPITAPQTQLAATRAALRYREKHKLTAKTLILPKVLCDSFAAACTANGVTQKVVIAAYMETYVAGQLQLVSSTQAGALPPASEAKTPANNPPDIPP